MSQPFRTGRTDWLSFAANAAHSPPPIGEESSTRRSALVKETSRHSSRKEHAQPIGGFATDSTPPISTATPRYLTFACRRLRFQSSTTSPPKPSGQTIFKRNPFKQRSPLGLGLKIFCREADTSKPLSCALGRPPQGSASTRTARRRFRAPAAGQRLHATTAL